MKFYCLQDIKMKPLHSAAKDNAIVAVEEMIKSGENVNDVDKVCTSRLHRTYSHVFSSSVFLRFR